MNCLFMADLSILFSPAPNFLLFKFVKNATANGLHFDFAFEYLIYFANIICQIIW